MQTRDKSINIIPITLFILSCFVESGKLLLNPFWTTAFLIYFWVCVAIGALVVLVIIFIIIAKLIK